MGTTLFSLASQFRELQNLADSEIDIDDQTIADTLEGLSGELQQKAQGVARFIANQDAMAEAIDNAAAAMKLRAERLRRRNDSMRQYLLVNMTAAGLTRIESPELVVAVKKNPSSVVVFDEAVVPEVFKVLPPTPPPPAQRVDKKAVADALKAGWEVAGCRLEQGARVDIK